jgi:glycosyltransferase involved in cell wall biosynthesis
VSPPTVSVVLPAWNAARWVGRAVRSALAQTLPPLEVIVADDGSTDGTAGAAAIAPTVRVLRLPHRGQAATTNAAIGEARGEWVAILHADDEWLPEKTATQLAALPRIPDAAVIYSDLVLVDPAGAGLGRFLADKAHAAEGRIFDALVEQCFVLPSAALIRRGLFAEEGLRFPEDLEVALDYELWLLASRRHPFLKVDAPLVRRTLLPGAASTRDAALHRDHVVLMRRLRESVIATDGPKAPSLPRVEARLGRSELLHAIDRYRDGDIAGARALLGRSLHRTPLGVTAAWWLLACLGRPARALALRLRDALTTSPGQP